MENRLARRAFLKSAPAAAGILAYAGRGSSAPPDTGSPRRAADVTMSSTPYTPVEDYPRRPTPHTAVALRDTFWKPKIATNAQKTIPFEFQKLNSGGGSRGLNGGVLEAAILSLQTHPDAALQAEVD